MNLTRLGYQLHLLKIKTFKLLKKEIYETSKLLNIKRLNKRKLSDRAQMTRRPEPRKEVKINKLEKIRIITNE